MFHRFLKVRTPFMLIALSGFQASGAQAANPFLEPTCARSLPLELNDTVRGDAPVPNAGQVFRLDVPATGVLTLDVTVPGSAEARPKLGLLSPGCGTSPHTSDPLLIERAAAYQVLAVDPGTYVFQLTAQDPRSALGGYKLTTGFATATEIDEAVDTESANGPPGPDNPFGPPPQNVEPEVVDPDPGFTPPLKVEPDFVDPDRDFTPPADKVEPEVVDPDPGLKQTLKIEPQAIAPDSGSGFALIGLQIPGGCPSQLDDHADTFTCATPLGLGRKISAEISSRHGDDDFFMITLKEIRTLEITSAGNMNTLGVLYDRFGQRLDVDDDGGQDLNFRIVRTLVPGRYFVRVEGQHREAGIYDLTLETLAD